MNAPGKVTNNFGHGPLNSGGYDPGAIGPTGLKESDQNADVGKRITTKLRANGWQVLEIQDGDLWDVVNASNAWKADYFISNHQNGSANPAAKGIETLIQDKGGVAETIGKEVQKELIKATCLYDRGVKVQNNQVTRETWCPAILVEGGFVTNPAEEALMYKDAFDELVAEAICVGFSRAVNVPYTNKSIAPVVVPVATPIPVVTIDPNPDTYITVRCRISEVSKAISENNKLGWAAKRLELA